MNHTFRIFLRIVSSFYGVLVMVLDDLQWADMGSLDLIETILTDRENPNIMIIGLYRSNEVNESHILTKKMSILQEFHLNDGSLDITEIEVENLDYDAVKSVTMDLLSLDDSQETRELVTLFYNRTQGNVFFLISFISMLEEEQLLDYNLTQFRYTWDVDRIQSRTIASANVVDLMQAKMSRLPKEYGLLLSVAACLGASFDVEKLEIVLHDLDSVESEVKEQNVASVRDMMATLIEEGFVERVKEWNTFRWIHDKVQEAAHSLMPSDELRSLKVRVGNILCKDLNDDDLESCLFLVMNMLNEATVDSITYEDRRIEMAELNLRATEKSVYVSAFSSANRYAKKGIEFLPEDCWASHYKLTLELYSYVAESSKFLGNNEETLIYCNSILKRKDVPIIDKFRANTVKVAHMCGIHRHKKAGKVLKRILSHFGFKFPKFTPFILLAIVKGIVGIKLNEKNYSLEKAAGVQFVTDTKQVQAMQYLDRLSNCLYMAGDPLLPVVCLQGAMASDRHGVCDTSPILYVTAALVLIVVGDFHGAEKIADYALALLKRSSKLSESAAKFKSGMFVYGWIRPYHFPLNLLLEAYQSGMVTGDIEYAMYAIASYCAMQFTAGRRLGIILEDCKVYINQAREHKSFVAASFMEGTGQAVQNLTNDLENTVRMEGDIIPDLDEFFENSRDNAVTLLTFWACHLRLCSIFEEYEKGADLFVEHGFDWPDQNPGHIMYMSNVCDGGLCCLEMAKRKTKKRRKYKRFANKAYATLKRWYRKGNPNVQHYKRLFDAEWAAKSKNYDMAEKCFQDTIAMSARGGFIHDAAVASERYMKFLLHDREDIAGAEFQLEKSIEFYDEWGAIKKVVMMENQYADLRTTEIPVKSIQV